MVVKNSGEGEVKEVFRFLSMSTTFDILSQQIDVFDVDCKNLGKLTNIRIGHQVTTSGLFVSLFVCLFIFYLFIFVCLFGCLVVCLFVCLIVCLLLFVHIVTAFSLRFLDTVQITVRFLP